MSLVNVPNFITFIRMIIGFVTLYFLFFDSLFISGILLAVFLLLDLVDGWIARRLKQTTVFGAYFDNVLDGGVPLLYVLGLSLVGVVPWFWYGVGLLGAVVRGFGSLYLFKRCKMLSFGHNLKRMTEGIFVTMLIIVVFGVSAEWFVGLAFLIYLVGAVASWLYLEKK